MPTRNEANRDELPGSGEMVYNTQMRRVMLVLLVVFLAGCSRPAVTIATHLNNREFYYNRYLEECVVAKGPETCEAFQRLVNEYKTAVIEAEAAQARGGRFPLQLKALEDSLKKVKSARSR